MATTAMGLQAAVAVLVIWRRAISSGSVASWPTVLKVQCRHQPRHPRPHSDALVVCRFSATQMGKSLGVAGRTVTRWLFAGFLLHGTSACPLPAIVSTTPSQSSLPAPLQQHFTRLLGDQVGVSLDTDDLSEKGMGLRRALSVGGAEPQVGEKDHGKACDRPA